MTNASKPRQQPGASIVLFDGVCNLCNGFVDFLIRRDKRVRLMYASLQSPAGQQLLDRVGAPGNLKTMVLVESTQHYVRSAAVLRIVGYLGAGWPLLRILLLIPRPLRDLVYDYVAENRYRWFRRRTVCRIPTTDEKHRFLDDGAATSTPVIPRQTSRPRI